MSDLDRLHQLLGSRFVLVGSEENALREMRRPDGIIEVKHKKRPSLWRRLLGADTD